MNSHKGIYGYKIAGKKENYLVTLYIPYDARTNIGRSNVKHFKTAKYRCDKAYVLSILNLDNVLNHHEIESTFDNNFKFRVGTFIEEPLYDPDPESVCAPGIHFFITRVGAYFYKKSFLKVNGNGSFDCCVKNKMRYKKQKRYYMKRYGLKKHMNNVNQVKLDIPENDN